MIKFFRKIRQNLLSEGKTGTYLKYAIGEIILVVIGILIALQIDNWNDQRKAQNELKGIFKSVQQDLIQDIATANEIIEQYEVKQKIYTKLLAREITSENYRDYGATPNLTTSYQPFTVQKKGYELLGQFKINDADQNDTLIVSISQFYTTISQLVSKSNDFVQDNVFENLQYFQEMPWFVDWAEGRTTEEMITYFTTSEDYRKRAALHKILATDNHLKFIEQYRDEAEQLQKQIHLKLKTK